jgi:pyrroloquinoline quinone (PQQ) biosynthesis protein C
VSFTSDLLALRDQRHTKNHPLFDRWVAGELTVPQMARFIAQHYHFAKSVISTFGICFAKTVPEVQKFMIGNLAEEFGIGDEYDGHHYEADEDHGHNDLLLRFAAVGGLSAADVEQTELLPGTRALLDFLWRIAYNEPWQVYLAAQSSLESQMVGLQQRLLPAFSQYGFERTDKRIQWFAAHETADIRHSEDALALIAKYVTNDDLAERCRRGVIEACDTRLRYYDNIYRAYVGPQPELTQSRR